MKWNQQVEANRETVEDVQTTLKMNEELTKQHWINGMFYCQAGFFFYFSLFTIIFTF